MQKGQKMSEEQRKKISEAHIGKKKPWSGQYMTPEHKLEISKRMKGNTLSRGRVLSAETKEKIRLSNLGKKHNITDEGRERMRTKNYTVWNKGTKGVMTAWNKGKVGVMGRHWNQGNDTRKEVECVTCGVTFKTHRAKFCSNKCSYLSRKGEGNSKWIKDRTQIVGRHVRNAHDAELKQWRKRVFARDMFTCKVKDETCLGRIESHHILPWKENKETRYETFNGITLCHKHHVETYKKESLFVDKFQKLVS